MIAPLSSVEGATTDVSYVNISIKATTNTSITWCRNRSGLGNLRQDP